MTFPLNVAFEGGLTASDGLRRRIEDEVARLERFEDRIVGFRVAVIGPGHRHQHGGKYRVRLQISTPGGRDVVIDRDPGEGRAHEDAYLAIRDAFKAARRRLQDRARRADGQVKTHVAQPVGRVARVIADQDYGFIESADGRDIYFHRNAVANGAYDRLTVGDRVRFVETEGDKGAQASTVVPLGHG